MDAKISSSVGGRGGSGREKGQHEVFAVVSVVSVSKLNIFGVGAEKTTIHLTLKRVGA